jgi:divalent metal cation (Fe/Co/Zn/Cd) transporter
VRASAQPACIVSSSPPPYTGPGLLGHDVGVHPEGPGAQGAWLDFRVAILASPQSHLHASTIVLARRARALAYVTVTWMVLEACVSVWAATRAGSVALLGFGLDSVVEVISGVVVLWRFSGHARVSAVREARAAHLVSGCLLTLSVVVAGDGMSALLQHRAPATSAPGIAIAAASMVLMPLLAHAKRRVADQTGSRALAGDARQGDICAWLAAVTLVGLVLHATLGWWWIDPVAGLLLVPLIVREGLALRHARSLADGCCS